MNIFSRLTAKTMKQNKTRTIVTIIGVVLSTAMITAVTTFGSSIQEFMISRSIEIDGSWHVRVDNVSGDQIKDLQKRDEVETIALGRVLGYAPFDGPQDGSDYLYVRSFTQEAWDMLPIELTLGRMPENDREILVPDYLISQMIAEGNPSWIGKQFTLTLGKRMYGDEELYANIYVDEEDGEETFVPDRTEDFTVVGAYGRFADMTFGSGYDALAGPSKEETRLSTVYIQMRNPKNVYSFMEEMFGNEDGWIQYNAGLLRWTGVFRGDNTNRVLKSVLGILIGIIMLGSISLIYNAFSISLRERTTQFGLLSSVGATKRQLRKSLRFEAFAVSLIGIPLGILSGILGIGITMHFIGSSIATWIVGGGQSIKLSISWEAVALAALIAFGTVMVSVWIPSRRIRRISPMEAIRASRDIRIAPSKIRSGRLTSRIFGLEGMLAQKNYARDSKKYRSTVISLTMSMVLFVSASLFLSYMVDASGIALSTTNADIVVYADEEANEQVKELVRAGEMVDSWTEYKEENLYIPKDHTRVMDGLSWTTDENGWEGYSLKCIFLPDDQFLKYAKEEKADGNKGLLYDKAQVYDQDEQKYREVNVFPDDLPTEFELYQIKNDPVQNKWLAFGIGAVQVEKRSRQLPDEVYGSGRGGLILILPESMRSELDLESESIYNNIIGIQARNYRQAAQDLNEGIKEAGLEEHAYIEEPAVEIENDRNIQMAIYVLAYGFITLISLIAAVNVFNTVSTNLMLRRKEFAMLRSVGMTSRAFRKMQNYECLIYGIRATLYGCIISAGISYLMYLALNQGVMVGFRMPWNYMLMGTSGIFVVVFLSMFYTMHKIRKQNIVEELKMD